MNKKFTKLIAAIALLVFMMPSLAGWGQTADVIYDFTGSDWTVNNGTLSNGTVSFTGYGKDNFKMNSGYFFLGKSGAYLNFPTYASAVEKIVITGKSGASPSVKQNIYVGDVAVSTETEGATGTNTYEIATASQAAGTHYTLKVTSSHNTQITKIEIFYASAAPSYTITAQSNNNEWGTVDLSGTTITATPAEGYRVSTETPYEVTPAGSATVTQNGNSFSVAATSDCTVQINFEAIPTHTATFSVDGANTTQSFAEGAAITFPTNPDDINGKTFMGWTTAAIDGTTNTAPTFVISATMGDIDVTYYACFALVSGGPALLTKMTSTDSFTAGDNVVIVANDGEYEYAMYQETQGTTYVKKWSFVNDVEIVAADDKNWFTVSAGSDNTWKLGDATNGYVYNGKDNDLNIDTENSTNFTLAWNSAEEKFTLKKGSRWLSYRSDLANTYFRMGGTNSAPSGTGYFDIYKYVASTILYSEYCTTIENTLGITGYGESNNHWYLIASPLTGSTDLDAISGLVGEAIPGTNDPVLYDFDLYRFNQNAAQEWENYHNHDDFQLVNGQGYLYASKENKILVFDGTTNTNTSMDVDLVYTASQRLAGWNLVGNPFPVKAYVNRSYYKMNDAGTGILATQQGTSNAVAPCTGILVKAESTETNPKVTFSTTALSNSNLGNLNLVVAQAVSNRGNAATLDNAIVSFNEGSQLEKFYFMEQNANLYIPQNGKDYAIATAEAQGEMPVNFKARENGTYTLTVNPENVEMGYLHLIDNMTGADIDLLSTPSYTFNATTRDYESRFRLVFSANDENGASTGSATFAFISDGNLIVNNEGEATLQVVDLTGRILSNETIDGSHSMSMNAAPGVYMIRLINGNNVKVQKIVVR